MTNHSIFYSEFIVGVNKINQSLESFEVDLMSDDYSHKDFLKNSFIVLLCSLGENYFRIRFEDYIDTKNQILKNAQIKSALIKYTTKKEYPKDNSAIDQIFQLGFPMDEVSLSFQKIKKYYIMVGINLDIERSLVDSIEELIEKRNSYAHKQVNANCTVLDIKRYLQSLEKFIIICDNQFPEY